MAINLFHKYLWLADTIFRARRITFGEIATRWLDSDLSEGQPLSLRTFHNHRKAIEQIFDINIACDLSHNEYYIENLDELGGNGTVTRWLLNSFAVSNLMRESKTIGDRILLEDIPSAQRWLTPLVEAMRDNHIVEMTYQSFLAEAPGIRQLHPYFVKLYNKRWYVYGRTDDDPTIKVYALDRILDVVLTERTFELPDGFSAGEHLYNSIGILRMSDKKPCALVVKADAERSKYLRTRPLHHSQREVETYPGYSLFSYWIEPSPELYRELLFHGEWLEVVSPAEVREGLSALAQEIAERHE